MTQLNWIICSFTAFNVEAGTEPGVCDYDYLNVYAGSTADAPLLNFFCGGVEPLAPLSSQVSSGL